MINLKKHVALLGLRAKDKVTGLEGIVTTVTFDLYGCIQVILHPGLDETGKAKDQCWFDVNRLVVIDPTPVMQPPEFDWSPEKVARGDKGPAEKPATGKF